MIEVYYFFRLLFRLAFLILTTVDSEPSSLLVSDVDPLKRLIELPGVFALDICSFKIANVGSSPCVGDIESRDESSPIKLGS